MKRGTNIAMMGGVVAGGVIVWMWPHELKAPEAQSRSLTGRSAPQELLPGKTLTMSGASSQPSASTIARESVSLVRSTPADGSLSKARIAALIGNGGQVEGVHKALTTALHRAIAYQSSQHSSVELQGNTTMPIAAVPRSNLDEVAAGLAEELGAAGIASEVVQTVRDQFRADLDAEFGQESVLSARLVDYLPGQSILEPGFLIRTEPGVNQEAAVPLGGGLARYPWITVPAEPKGEREQTVLQMELPADFVLPD